VPEAPSILDTRVCGTDYRDIFCLYSLSKQSNMAGYRGAFIAGDPERIATLTQLRKHAGFMMPTPIQHAMAVALGDEAHVTAQKETYRLRREALSGVLEAAGLRNDPKSVAGLYLWAEDASGRANGWEIVNACARIGIVVAPGDFYGEAARGRVRISLTATDEAIGEAIRRLPALPGELRHAAAKPRER
jgi:aspartate/methionine/tyrosine aminotransferase